MWNRTSHSCMNVSHSAKVLSRTIIRAIRDVQKTLPERDGALECYEALACVMNDFFDIFNGKFERSDLERRMGLNKNKGYVRSSESVMIDLLMGALSFFDDWQNTLQVKNGELGGDDGAWKTHFITRESWCDLRLCVLGFVGMCRYLYADTQRFKIGQLCPDHRYLSLRACSQDICEQRFAHIRTGGGTTRNPTARMTKRRYMQGDQHRGVHGFSRANAHKNVRKEAEPDLAGSRGKLMLSVTDEERRMTVDARSKGFVESVRCPRVVEVEPLVFPKVPEKRKAPVNDSRRYQTRPKASAK